MTISCLAQNAAKKEHAKYNSFMKEEVLVLDIIEINDPVLVKFREANPPQLKKNHVNSLLVSKKYLESIPNDTSFSFKDFLCSRDGAVFFHPITFRSLILSYPTFISPHLLQDSSYKDFLLNETNSWNPVYVKYDSTKFEPKEKTNGWELVEIIPRKFILCLIKGRILYRQSSSEEIRIENMDNTYFKLLFPLVSAKRP
ncbi:MAG: hypothetical protein U0264_04465 [Candidatus Kapaibacterium sp.]